MLNYEIFGNGTPLVLFHGWGFDRNIWKPLVPVLLNNDFELYLVDLPGFGQTPNLDWFFFKTELLNLLPNKFIVLGWSLGGLFATRLTIEAPERVAKFINVASSPRFVNADDWIGIDKQVLNDFHNKFTSDPRQTRFNFINSQLLIKSDIELDLSEDLNVEGLENGLHALTTWDLREHLLEVKVPGLFIFGKLDGIISQRVMLQLQNKYPNFEYVMLRNSAHLPFLSHTEKFLESLIDFCRKNNND